MRTVVVLSAFLFCSCAPVEQRLPEPTQEVNPPPQWVDYCKREGEADPACEQE